MHVRTFGLLFAAAVFATALGSPGPARATTYPPDTLLPGEVQQAVVSNQCYIVRGSSDFLRNGAAGKASVTVSNMVAGGYEVNGHIVLVFTSTTGGTAHLNFATAYPSNIQVAPFTEYGQSYSAAAKSLHAHFTIDFPGCSLTVSGVYTSP
jgi:hypothetical protein